MNNFVIFTYKDDYNSLIICVKYILKCEPSAKIWIYDDLYNPFNNEQKAFITSINSNIVYKQTTFNRQGTFRMRNLNGHECIRSMAQIYNDIANDNEGNVIKIDSDTILTSSKVFDDLNNNSKVIGFECLNPYEFSGICYGLSNQACKDIAKHAALTKFTPPTDINYFAEDVTFSRIASYLYGHPEYDLKRNQKEDGSIYIVGINQYNDNVISVLQSNAKNITAIHCGQEAFARNFAQERNITYREAVFETMKLIDQHIYDYL